MCGIAGLAFADPRHVEDIVLRRIAGAIRHRGPDGYGVFTDGRVSLVHTRLAIIDLAGGAQPLGNEDGLVQVVFNGEIYNYRELRAELVALGHRFATHSDTEVLVHGYEAWGLDLLRRLIGQFAFALYDRRDGSLLLARDRFGVRPLFHARVPGGVVFGSEVKALFASGLVQPAPDPRGLDEVYTFWAALPPRTPFRGVESLEPGCWARYRRGQWQTGRYYAIDYPAAPVEPADAVEQLDHLLRSAVDLRMRADVPVGSYLSGGLDSTITCTLAAELSPHRLRTFSVTFEDPRFDESPFQREVAASVGSEHAVETIGPGAIAESFPDVIRFTETPLVRTAPVPLFLLARLTRERGITVALSGEGADEVFLGYDLFKEVKIRRFCQRRPDSQARPKLFQRLYPYLGDNERAGEFWSRFFLDAGVPGDPLESHLPRFRLTSAIKDFYSADMRGAVSGSDPLEELRGRLPDAFRRWTPVHRAAYLELVTLLSPYLLPSQGDRVGLAHAVEGRHPFLDHRLFELAARLPESSKLRGLREKDILRRWSRGVIPDIVTRRPKQPYRAPDIPSFVGTGAPEYVREHLAEDRVRAAGFFDTRAVAGLMRRADAGKAVGFRENQAFVGILSAQLWHEHFFRNFDVKPVREPPDVWIDTRRHADPVDSRSLNTTTTPLAL
jgi:asparagine synthase (glutamine-hydrolysing)